MAARRRIRARVTDHRYLQPQAVRAKVVVPVPHQARLVQDRGHARVLARLAARGVLGAAAGAGQHGRGENSGPGLPGRGHPGDAAGRGGNPAGLAAAGGQ